MLNRIVIMGRLTRDPEIRNTQSGVMVVSFTLAVDRDYKTQNGDRQTDFIDCTAWRNTADFICKYFSKGKMMIASGRLETGSYEDNNGIKRKTADVVVESAYFGDSKRDNEQSSNSGQSSYQQPYPQSNTPPPPPPPTYDQSGYPESDYEQIPINSDDDLPF